MVLDAARGIEAQTLKLFEVCRLRDVPIITFINKLDREAREPFELLDEIEQKLALDVTPANWPIGMGQRFKGCFDVLNDALVLVEPDKKESEGRVVACEQGLADAAIERELPESAAETLREELEMAKGLCPSFDREQYLQGHLTPVFFGSALRTFGVKQLLTGLAEYAPSPRDQVARQRSVSPEESKVSGFVFKIQANMDPKHRDRVAFVRLCSGHFKRGMKMRHVRTNSDFKVHNPLLFLAQDRELAEEAWAGDIIGIPNHGRLRIGDTLTEGEDLTFTGIPSFAPELLQTVRAEDPLRAKHLGRALVQLAEEGAARVFKARVGGVWVVGVVGALQFDVLADRIRTEYEIPVRFESTSLFTARWVEADDPLELKRFVEENQAAIADDHTDSPVFMARNSWHLERAAKDFPKVRFLKTKEQTE